jgi:hypothetical protein
MAPACSPVLVKREARTGLYRRLPVDRLGLHVGGHVQGRYSKEQLGRWSFRLTLCCEGNHAAVSQPLIEARRDQMFPTLTPVEIGRLTRFGERKSYAAGESIVATGKIAPGAFVILTGRVEVSQRGLGHSDAIVTHRAGSFMGELAQLSDRPALVDAVASEPVEALLIPARRLRDLLMEEAELGERIMRALILRRVGLLETGGGGPVIGGPQMRDVVGAWLVCLAIAAGCYGLAAVAGLS